MPSPVSRALAVLCVLGMFSAVLPASEPPAGKPGDKPPAEKEKKDELPSVEKAVKGLEKIDGLLPLYRKKDKLLVMIPNEKLGTPMMLAASIAGGSQLTGFQWSDMMVKFERHGKTVLLIRPETRYRSGKKEPISSAVERTHPGYLVASLPILGEDPRKGVVVDLMDLYTKQAPAFIGTGLTKNRDSSLARLTKVKNFPQNTEVAVDLIAKPQGRKHGDILTVHYSLSSLPKSDYVPRLADDRVGYFLTVSRDYSKDYRDDTTFLRYINRWGLEKADPSLDLSPPREPIVFYIEKTVPTRYRRHVRDGILEWNEAFEKVGFSNAMEVRQQTDTQFADLDPEDVRYNFFRWIISDWSFAMGPSRVDPRTGQILDADILFDDSMVRSYVDDWDVYLEEAILETFTPEDISFLREHPEWDPVRLLNGGREPSPRGGHPLLAMTGTDEGPWSQNANEPLGSGRTLCTIGRGLSRQMALASLRLGVIAAEKEDDEEEGEGPKEREWPEEFIGQIIKDIVMHEVGHTLGLRHNFKASSWRPYSDLNPDGDQEPPGDLTGSVMDYNPLNLAEGGKEQGNYTMTTLGPYDYWAIEYGYSVTGAKAPEAERDDLREIASRGAESGHDYGTDEDLSLGDPLIRTWDYGSDSLDYARGRIALARSLKEEAVERMVRDGESYESARRAVNILFSSIGYSCNIAAGYVGGTYFHRDHRGDPDARDPIVVVPAEKQREALHMLRDNLFAAGAFDLSPELLRKLAPSRWSHWGTQAAWGADAAYPFHNQVLGMQAWALHRIMSPSTMRRVMDAELAAPEGEEPLALPELFIELTAAIFSELDEGSGGSWTNADPLIPGVRRNLQRYYLSRLIGLTLEAEKSRYPRTARTLAWYELRKMNERLGGFLDGAGGLDDYSRAHLEESRERVGRALEASFQLRS